MIKNLNLYIKYFLPLSFIASVFYILIYNVLHYDPILGYDAEAHYAYIDTFSRYLPRRIRIPTSDETREFFNPPIAYVFPAIIQVFCRNLSNSVNLLKSCQPIYGNIGQIFQSFLYIITIAINLKTLKLVLKSNRFSFSYIILTSMLAVNYRTISMIRGEIYILFFMSLLMLLLVRFENKAFIISNKEIFIFGVLIGCLALSRQWAFLLFPSLIIYFIKCDKKVKREYFSFLSKSFAVGFFISGWFYFINLFRYGSFIAFNMPPTNEGYFDRLRSLLSLEGVGTNIFSNPIRPYFKNQFFPILYSDTWGDYWGYFTFTSRFLEIGLGQENIGSYLGRVNLVSTFTFVILLIGTLKSYKQISNKALVFFIKYSILFSLLGYLWFVLGYPTGSGDTIKSTYLIQMFNLMTFITAILLDRLRNNKIYISLITILLIIYAHNFSSFLSKFPINFPY